jgi:hypothetical protein
VTRVDRSALRDWANGTDPMLYVRSFRPHDQQTFNASDVIALLDDLEAAETERDRLARRVEAIEALHYPETGWASGRVYERCNADSFLWPCATIRALTGG